eukprot:6361485-Heterocapsa_arctica.AAC.1
MSLMSSSSVVFILVSSAAVRLVRSRMLSIRRSSQSFSLVSSRRVTWAMMLLVTSATTFLPMSM